MWGGVVCCWRCVGGVECRGRGYVVLLLLGDGGLGWWWVACGVVYLSVLERGGLGLRRRACDSVWGGGLACACV